MQLGARKLFQMWPKGHQVKDCPRLAPSRAPQTQPQGKPTQNQGLNNNASIAQTQGKLFALIEQEAQASKEIIEGTLTIKN